MSTDYETFQDNYLGIRMIYPRFLVPKEKMTQYYNPEFVTSGDKLHITPFIMKIMVAVSALNNKNLPLEEVWESNFNYEEASNSILYDTGYINISGTRGKFAVYGIPILRYVDVMAIKNEKIYQLAFEVGPFSSDYIANKMMNEAMNIVYNVINSFAVIS